jgi:hypothetical protein
MPTGEKAANSLSVKPAQAKITAATNKQTVIEASEAFEVVKNESKGELTYEKVKGNAKIAVSANGNLTIAKGLKKGKTYAVTANVSSAETGEYQAATTDVKIKVRAKAPNKLKVAPAKGAFTATSSTKTIIPAKDAFKVKKNTGGGELAYKKVKGNAKIKVSNRGKVTITKGLEKGKTFTVTVNASSAETVEYLSAETAVKLKVKVK